MSTLIDLSDRTFRTLEVTRRSTRRSRPNGGRVYWWTRCIACGVREGGVEEGVIGHSFLSFP